MNIVLDKDYSIVSDDNCLILQKRGVIADENSKNFGKEKFDTVGYYMTIESACDGFIKKRVIGSDATTLQELAREIGEIKRNLRDSLAGEDGGF